MATDRSKMWGGRFEGSTDAFVQKFTASVEFDKRLFKYDIEGSKQHARMLYQVGALSFDEQAQILEGLEKIKAEIEQDRFDWSVELEDVHMNIEARLIEMIGDPGRKLHTGRSRNDQVATDIRLWLDDQINEIVKQIHECQKGIVDLAEANLTTLMPGFTHLQSAQPVSFAHHLLAWFEMIERDRNRFLENQERVRVSPLGAAALAGTTYPIDREFTRANLGFTTISRNSLDAVSDRDFAIEFVSTASILMVHLSRWCEEIVFWNSSPIGMISLPDSHCTGSSIMPQKKNPDVAELVRGKTGRVVGHLNALLMLMKSQPLAYNKDNQEDKEPLFDSVDTVRNCLYAMSTLICEIQPNTERMYELASAGFPTATDLADWLVRKGVTFRDSHEIVGQVVVHAENNGCQLNQLTLNQLRSIYDGFDASAFDVLSIESAVKARNHVGGTAPDTVKAEIARINKLFLSRTTDNS